VDSEFVHGRVNKLLHEVAIDLVDLLYLEDSYVKSSLGFYFETVRFIGFLKLSYRSAIYFPLFCMI